MVINSFNLVRCVFLFFLFLGLRWLWAFWFRDQKMAMDGMWRALDGGLIRQTMGISCWRVFSASLVIHQGSSEARVIQKFPTNIRYSMGSRPRSYEWSFPTCLIEQQVWEQIGIYSSAFLWDFLWDFLWVKHACFGFLWDFRWDFPMVKQHVKAVSGKNPYGRNIGDGTNWLNGVEILWPWGNHWKTM